MGIKKRKRILHADGTYRVREFILYLVKMEIDNLLEDYDFDEDDPTFRSRYHEILGAYIDTIKWLEDEQKKYAPRFERAWKPTKVMKRNKFFMKNLDKTRLTEVFNFIMNNTVPKSQTAYFSHRFGYYEISKDVFNERVFFVPNFARMKRACGRSEATCRKYLQALSKFNIIQKLGKIDTQGGHNVYAVGYYPKGATKVRRVYFFQGREAKKRHLVSFVSNLTLHWI